MLHATQHCATEFAFESGRSYEDPLNQVQLDVVFRQRDGRPLTMPAFWAGDNTWRVRYAPLAPGTHHYRSICSDTANGDLHGCEGEIAVEPYAGDNPLLWHGPLRVAGDRRHLEHADGTPFFWLGDTWWMALCSRLHWPDEFQELVADRAGKGFTVAQIVAGLYPDMPPFDLRGANEAGQAWEPEFARIRPAYFDMADVRFAHVVRQGIVPCIFGCWGYYLQAAGSEVLRRHWRYLVARYAAYPVIWSIAGEAMMDYYLRRVSPDEREEHEHRLRAEWGALARYVRSIDPYGHPIGIHPTRFGHEQVDDPSVLDIDLLQTGHLGHTSLAATVDYLEQALAHEPRMPVLVDEANYEGIMESSREEMQRFLFWTAMLGGACGHTYGANGLWQVNRREQPYGPSPHGTAWGNRPWDEAYRLPGSGQLGLGKRLLERYDWWRLEPHPEWVEPHQGPDNRFALYAAGVPGQVRLTFIPAESIWTAWRGQVRLRGLDANSAYCTFWFDPLTGDEYPLGGIQPESTGEWVVPKPPIFQDWVLVLEG